jgi:hypothetical protein
VRGWPDLFGTTFICGSLPRSAVNLGHPVVQTKHHVAHVAVNALHVLPHLNHLIGRALPRADATHESEDLAGCKTHNTSRQPQP